MDNNITTFIDKFKEVKNKSFNKSLRAGYTGIGFTYEALIGKKEDNSYNPDFNGIEIKTKLGYSKTSITLFTLVPQSEKGIKYIYNKYAYKRSNNQSLKCLRCDVYSNLNFLTQNKYIMRLRINRLMRMIELIVLNSSYEKIDGCIYWTFESLKERLETKLQTLALVKGYPYKKNNEMVYKYTNLSIYKLKNFETFIKMIEENKIYITFNIGTHRSKKRYGQIYDRGTAFKINSKYIEELFTKIY